MLDYHVHTRYCGHASGEMEEYVQAGIEKGLAEIGFSGHYPYPESLENPPADCVIPAERWDEYLREAIRLREMYRNRITVRVGAEFDWLGPEISFHPLEMARHHRLDFCLGSVHMVDGVTVDLTPSAFRAGLGRFSGGIDGAWRRYFEAVAEMSAPGWCTTIGHLDLVKKFSNHQELAPQLDHSQIIDKALDRIAAAGLVLEVNASGWDKPCARQYPAEEIIVRALARGIRLTAGSDAHAPSEVGRHFDRLKAILSRLGVRRLVRFENLRPLEYEIS
ncbi:MAG TPA: histidinol-phosphatase HisJ [Candidatus Glassbacteria bacterium]|nr:histidinol-phosphatase HisJ [Candidatus Glassbacteria bacterium]